MSARYEIVRTTQFGEATGEPRDGWYVRFISANNRTVWVTPGFHERKRGSEKAIESITGEPLRRALISGFVEVHYLDERLHKVDRPSLPELP